jgi:hypothetical protein
VGGLQALLLQLPGLDLDYSGKLVNALCWFFCFCF